MNLKVLFLGGAMISRYTHPEMDSIWSQAAKFESWLTVEWAVLEVLSDKGTIPISRKRLDQLRDLIQLSPERISEIEATTRHDVIAFVTHVAEQTKDVGNWVHYGLTSSDVIDTALSLQIKKAAGVLKKELQTTLDTLSQLINEHGDLMIMGRTHGVAAQPMTLGQKFALWGTHLSEVGLSLFSALNEAASVKLSGAVGNYPILSETVELEVAEKLGLPCVRGATQVIGRHVHARMHSELALMGSVIEKISVDIRSHQRSHELMEGFVKGQKGSSAMPHKKNPIGCENLTGIARLLRGYANSASENVALWMERDISHSSVERVIIPDAFQILAYGLKRFTSILKNLHVNPEGLEKNLKEARNTYYSQMLHLKLLRYFDDRSEAYDAAQKASFEAHELNADFIDVVQKNWPELDISDWSLACWQSKKIIHSFEEVKRHVSDYPV